MELYRIVERALLEFGVPSQKLQWVLVIMIQVHKQRYWKSDLNLFQIPVEPVHLLSYILQRGNLSHMECLEIIQSKEK
jgi:hypothetical protein